MGNGLTRIHIARFISVTKKPFRQTPLMDASRKAKVDFSIWTGSVAATAATPVSNTRVPGEVGGSASAGERSVLTGSAISAA